MTSFVVPSHGLERAAAFGEDGFMFIGHECTVQCTQFQAAFISPRVHFLLRQDKTIDSLCIETRTEGIDGKRIFGLFDQLINGLAIVASDSDLPELSDHADFLGNTELLDQFPGNDKLDVKKVCSRLRQGDICASLQPEIEFVASHFTECDFDDLEDLDICLIEEIVSSSALRLNDEDSLLEFIRRIDCGPILLRHVFCECLTSEGMSAFLALLPRADIDPVIWSSLCSRLLLPVSPGISLALVSSLQFAKRLSLSWIFR
jgi:hypothetical protein